MEETISYNKATGEVIGSSPLHSVEDLQLAMQQARAAQDFWGRLSVAERIPYMIRVRDYIVEHIDELALIVAQDNGKTRTDALVTEILPAAMGITYYNRMARKFLKDKPLKSGSIALLNKRSKIVRVPYGVIGVISPWNYPYSIPFSEVVMGLLAGNCVILKTASETQQVGLALKRSIEAAGLPQGVFSYVNMPGRIAGDAFLEAGVDKLFLTGSVAVGKQLMQKASETLTPLSLELGGNDPMLVCASADLEKAAAGALWAGFQNAGQSCGGVERIYVHREVYEPFLKLLKAKVEALRVGYDTDFNVDMGTMTTARQKEAVERHVADALEKGATIYAQSSVPADAGLRNFHPAMLITDVNHEMLLMRDETFGPVVGVMRVDDMQEAIALANDSYLGLTASVWSQQIGEAEKIARRLQTGVVNINDHLMSHGMAETPWGGFKQSSIGRSHGEIGFEEMTQPQVVIKDLFIYAKRGVWWHPFDKRIYDGIKGIMQALYGHALSERLLGAARLLRIFPRIFSR